MSTTHADDLITADLIPKTVKITKIQSEIAYSPIMIVIENKGPEINLAGVLISLPAGDKETDLVLKNKGKDLARQVSDAEKWSFTNATKAGSYEATPNIAYGTVVPFPTGASFSFTFTKVPLCSAVGVAEVEITIIPAAGTPIVYKPAITKVENTDASVEFTGDHKFIQPGMAVKLSWKGKFIDKYTLSFSSGEPSQEFRAAGGFTHSPKDNITYTLDAENFEKKVHLQLQYSVAVLNPLIKSFRIEVPGVDQGDRVKVAWETEEATGVLLKFDHSTIPPFISDRPQADFSDNITIGPFQRITKVRAYATKGAIHSKNDEEQTVEIKPPRVESFNITAEPLEPGKRVRFKLDWVIKNTTRFQITEHYAGQIDPHKLVIPEGVTTYSVYPTHAETTYKLEAQSALKKDEEESVHE
jgi:hypothetical protein